MQDAIHLDSDFRRDDGGGFQGFWMQWLWFQRVEEVLVFRRQLCACEDVWTA